MKENNLSKKDKKEILDCASELQSHMFRGLDAEESFKKLAEKYSNRTIHMSMELLKQAKNNKNSPFAGVTDVINRCMSKLDRDWISDNLESNEGFYKVCDLAYKDGFMQDKEGRGIPIVFLWVKGNSHLGVVPIMMEEHDKSPMDFLKEIVYNEKPDAYCMCAEASMGTGHDKDTHKYGDIINDPSSKDVVILQGNSKSGDMSYKKMYSISEDRDLVILHEMSGFGENMESDKLP